MSGYVVIGIHGMLNKPRAETKHAWWRAALLEGLRRNCGKTTAALEFDFVYWAHLFNPASIEDAANTEPYRPLPGEGPLPAWREQRWALLLREAGSFAGRPLDFAERHLGIGTLAEAVLQRRITDLARYYDNDLERAELRSLLRRTLERHAGKRIMLIAHSMGSIIAYDVLREMGRSHPGFAVEHLVTIGSPLGMPHVKHRIFMENDLVRTPSVVQRWTNLADRRDVVAIDPHLGDDFEPNDRGVAVEDRFVLNGFCAPTGKPNCHKSYGYLRTPEVSELVRRFC